ncbi:hypothetical protein ES332_A04G145100v1 [Gossypium tomentosum]|uniref:Uncharacterized protein n=1 Tax=Gossypium tomentosum TaxID=34277 RepID=A0A5D2QYS5_GOSTO|nr:hypothetical protein ES332_A04G145100v1 [Gossypium tomentosum]
MKRKIFMMMIIIKRCIACISKLSPKSASFSTLLISKQQQNKSFQLMGVIKRREFGRI